MQVKVEVIINDKRWSNKIKGIKKFAKDVSDLTLNYFPNLANGYDLSLLVVFTDNEEITEFNKTHMGKDRPTNVLSFPIEHFKEGILEDNEIDEEIFLGDIIIAYEVVEKEAKEQGKDFKHHATHLIIHSILHLIGFDHVAEEDAIKMEDIEIKLLAKLNITSPY